MSMQDDDQEFEVDDDLDFEIDDDTPDEDKGRSKAPDDTVDDDEPDDDELRNYSQDAQKRIKTLTRKRHDERRAKEDKERQLNEAANLIRTVSAENEKLRKSLTGAATSAVGATKSQVEAELVGIKKELAEAIELGEGSKVADLQEKLADAKWRLNGAVHAEGQLKRAEEDDKNRPAVQPTVSQADWPATRKAWAERNADWFQKDPAMTALAYGVHQKLIEVEGVVPDSKEYYDAIDKEMRARFPEKFDDEDDEKPQKGKAKEKVANFSGSSVVNRGGKKVYRLKQSQLDLCKRLGISPKDYVKQQLAMEQD